MKDVYVDCVVLGAGPGGLASAIKVKELGIDRVVLIESDERLGGILPQCIHPGFGIHYFKEDLTGPEFAHRLIKKLFDLQVKTYLNSLALKIIPAKYDEKIAIIASADEGIIRFHTKTIIYATGARERHRHELGIIGSRPAGVYTAGQAQAFMDLYGIMPGKDIVIVGSGDVGLIMARRFALQGANVKAVIEIMPYPGGLTRNIQQCLIDFGIPLYLKHKVVKINGRKRVESVVIVEVDENLSEIPGTEKILKCDTVVIAAGLIPNIDLLKDAGALLDPSTKSVIVNDFLESSIPGVFVIGNALVINDLVDYVVEQGQHAAKSAVTFITEGGLKGYPWKRVIKGNNIRLMVPQLISGEQDVIFYGRVAKPENNVRVVFEEINKGFFYLHVRPPEMLRIKVNRDAFEPLINKDENKITISIKKVKRG